MRGRERERWELGIEGKVGRWAGRGGVGLGLGLGLGTGQKSTQGELKKGEIAI